MTDYSAALALLKFREKLFKSKQNIKKFEINGNFRQLPSDT